MDVLADLPKQAATWLIHASLEGVSIPNVHSGYTIEFVDSTYSVYARLHGLDSCLSMILIAAWGGFLLQRSFLHTLLLIVFAFVSVTTGNVIHGILVCFIREVFEGSLSADIERYGLGLVVLLLQLFFLVTVDQAIRLLFVPLPMESLRGDHSLSALFLNRVLAWPNQNSHEVDNSFEWDDETVMESTEELEGIDSTEERSGDLPNWTFGSVERATLGCELALLIMSAMFASVVWRELNNKDVLTPSKEVLGRLRDASELATVEIDGSSQVGRKTEVDPSNEERHDSVKRSWFMESKATSLRSVLNIQFEETCYGITSWTVLYGRQLRGNLLGEIPTNQVYSLMDVMRR